SSFTSPSIAGASHTFTVTAKDAYSNTATGYTGTVTFSSSDSQAVLPANYTFVGGDNGVHTTFSATLKTVGAQSITATDTVTSTITGTQSSITVSPASASTLTVAGFSSSVTAGNASTFTVTAKDSFGNTATGYTGTVAFTTSSTNKSLPANYTFVGGDAGVHTLTATLNTVGTQSITATDTVTGTITGTQGSITVSAAGASSLTVSAFTS